MTTTDDPLARLEEKVLRAIELFKHTQTEKRALEREVEKLRAEIKERSETAGSVERELTALRREREEVRTRVEKLLERVDRLAAAEPEKP